MEFPARITDIQSIADKVHDVVVIGAGVAGAIIAKTLANAGKSIVLLEAGRATSILPERYASYVENFHLAMAKVPNSPYPQNLNAPSPSVLNQARVRDGYPVTTDYHVYRGPMPFLTDYLKTLGGTTMHFLGTCMRAMPNDLQMKDKYNCGVNWPIKFEALRPFYEEAECEIGVSADVDEQRNEVEEIAKAGKEMFGDKYQYPMMKLPPSHLDKYLAANLNAKKFAIDLFGRKYPVKVVGTPAGRNSMPNPKYKDKSGQPYRPMGMPYDANSGERCEGNSSCVPICPVMAKYNALRTLYSLDDGRGENLKIISQAVASKITLAANRKTVNGIVCKIYQDENNSTCKEYTFRGKYYVVTAHAIETAKLLLASDAANRSDMVGRNLMDHPYLLTWGLAPAGQRTGVFRGPQITSEVPLRDGHFRSHFAAFRADIRSGGWDFATGAPYLNALTLIRGQPPKFGADLRESLYNEVQRQVSFGFQIEQLPDPTNRVTIDQQYMDAIGNYRPVINYNIDDYSRQAMKVARKLFKDIMVKQLGGEDNTEYNNAGPGYLEVDGETFSVYGSGHIVGTHRMGDSDINSVTDKDLRTWDHDNLYLVGGGSMPTLGTANPTLTIAALACRASHTLLKRLGK
ncbi:MAG TPA: GMC family oxidoreductase [Gemmataceae bacterium]|jgi:choline dehydrogenase-like flavoprotein|nr:GMC family oxidoreductase [Gemmataceae bacterium]